MGLSVINEVATVFTNFITSLNGVARAIAWIGLGLIAIVVIYYLFTGIVYLAKAFVHLKVKYLGVALLLLGMMLLAIALVIPG